MALVCAAALAPSAHAQVVTGPIKGLVNDGQGQALPGATVVLMPGNIGTATNSRGEFVLAAPAGTYAATVSYLGYKTVTQSVVVTAGGTATLNVTWPKTHC